MGRTAKKKLQKLSTALFGAGLSAFAATGLTAALPIPANALVPNSNGTSANKTSQKKTGPRIIPARDYIRERGMPPEIYKESIRSPFIKVEVIANRDIWRYVGRRGGFYVFENPRDDSYQAFAMLTLKIGYKGLITALCRVIPEGIQSTPGGFIADSGIMPQYMIEHMPITKKQYEAWVLVHELTHCNPSNHMLGSDLMGEAQADYRGIKVITKLYGNPEIANYVMYYRALRLRLSAKEHHHDTSLHLDAKLKGKALPTAAQIAIARHDLRQKLSKYMKLKDRRPFAIRYYQAIKTMLHYEGHTLAKYTKRRAELFVEAVEYFKPSVKHRIKIGPNPRKRGPIRIHP